MFPQTQEISHECELIGKQFSSFRSKVSGRPSLKSLSSNACSGKGQAALLESEDNSPFPGEGVLPRVGRALELEPFDLCKHTKHKLVVFSRAEAQDLLH